MQQNNRLRTLLATLVLGFASCASTASSDAMAVTDFEANTAPIYIQEAITVTQVAGAPNSPSWYESAIINPEFKKALSVSLLSLGWLQVPEQARYHLTANIQEQETNMRGLDAEAWVTTRYVLIKAKATTPIYDHTIKTGFQVPHGVAFTGVEKMRLALEGAAKQNITELLQGLTSLPQ
ncbi:MAG: hypothetical protein ACJAZ8_000447 [Planctomycetota bacterium]|jgi:hypothetical protein